MDKFYTVKDDDLFIRIKAVPNSSKNEICGLYEDALKVKLKAPAVENKANEELVKYFAKLLKLPKSTVFLKSGGTSKHKTICCQNCSVQKLIDLGLL